MVKNEARKMNMESQMKEEIRVKKELELQREKQTGKGTRHDDKSKELKGMKGKRKKSKLELRKENEHDGENKIQKCCHSSPFHF